MTREFNKQQRNDRRPSLRNTSPNHYGEEQSPRPARPRLNRASVDRAWESGASHHHADYRPRSNNGQAPRQSWNNQRSDSNTSRRPSGARPYNDYREQNGRFERTPDNYQGSRSLNPERRNFSDQRPGERRGYSDRRSYSDQRPGEHRSYSDRRNASDDRRSFSGEHRSYSDRRSYSDQRPGEHRSYSGGPDARGGSRGPHSRGPQFRDQDRSYQDRKPGRNDHSAPSASNRRYAGQAPGRRSEPGRESDRPQRRPEDNPRWQSRPFAQRTHGSNEQQRTPRQQPPGAQFEGDYEYFEEVNQAEGADFPNSHPPQASNGGTERHITRLPDGRVVKGPRSVQRKNAQFWTDITEDAQELMEHINVIDEERSQVEESTEEVHSKPAPKAPKGTAARVKKPRSTGPKPSQRGFKWPEPK